MAGRSPRGRRIVGGALLAVAVVGASQFSLQSLVSAAGNLSSDVLSSTLPGLVAAPPGARNGPIDQSNLGLVTGGATGAAESQFAQALASGKLSAYIRTWTHQPANGDAVVITAYQFQNSSDAAQFVNGEGSSALGPGASAIDVSSVPDASGYVIQNSASGVPDTEYLVFFEKGNIDIGLVVVTKSGDGDLTAQDAASLASQQWSSLPAPTTPTNWTPIIRLIDFAGGIVLFVLIVVFARRRRYPAVYTTRPAAAAQPWSPPSPYPGQPT